MDGAIAHFLQTAEWECMDGAWIAHVGKRNKGPIMQSYPTTKSRT